MSEYIKSYANWQFNRSHKAEDNVDNELSGADQQKVVKRLYRHPARHKIKDADTRVRTTLLEYGVTGLAHVTQDSDSTSGTDKSSEQTPKRKDSDTRMVETLMNSMHSESSKISAAFVGSIVGAQSDEIQRLAEEYHKQKLELEENSIERKERLLRSKVEAKRKELLAAKQNESEIREKIQLYRKRIELVKEKQQSIEPTKNEEPEEEMRQKRDLTHIIDTLKKQKSEFKQFCREEKQRLEKQIEDLSNQTTDTEDETEVSTEVQDYEERHSKLKLQLADLNKKVAKLQRKFDDIPTRAELSQYQKRFIELYNQGIQRFSLRFTHVQEVFHLRIGNKR